MIKSFKDFVFEMKTKEIDPKEFPNPLKGSKADKFLSKGKRDGSNVDDIIKTTDVSISVAKLKPSQSAIYLGKSLGMAIGGVEGGDLGAVISADNHILDGHHRYAATTFNNPNAKVEGVQSKLDIGDLIPVLRAAGDAMKNKRGLKPASGDINIFDATIEDVKDCVYRGVNMDPKFYKKDASIAWFERLGEDVIESRLKLLQSKKPPKAAPPRKDMPKIEPEQVEAVKQLLNKGDIDVRAPYANESRFINEAKMAVNHKGVYNVDLIKNKTYDGPSWHLVLTDYKTKIKYAWPNVFRYNQRWSQDIGRSREVYVLDTEGYGESNSEFGKSRPTPNIMDIEPQLKYIINNWKGSGYSRDEVEWYQNNVNEFPSGTSISKIKKSLSNY